MLSLCGALSSWLSRDLAIYPGNMCGIAGSVSLEVGIEAKTPVAEMLASLIHRGPDGQGQYASPDGRCSLGHTRLSILDLSDAGTQPMLSPDGRFSLSYNGEVYNYVEIRTELEREGFYFRSGSDTEVLLAAFQKWGADALSRFNGMWAFLVYDNQTRRLFGARDRFGVKPLYYHRSAERLIVASEVQALHAVLGASHPLNESVVRTLASGSFDSHGTEETYLQGVKALPAGHFFELDLGRRSFEVKSWYRLAEVTVPSTYREQVEALRELVRDACRLRLRSDVEVATCLSGGVDSGAVTATIAELARQTQDNTFKHRAFCASFPGTPIDEKDQALRLAQQLGVKLNVLEILPPSPSDLEFAISQCDGPMHALAFFPIWSLYRFIKQSGISVTMDGQGPDEMLGGYRPLQEGLMAARELGDWWWYFDLYRTYAGQGETPQFSSKAFARKVLAQDLWRGPSARALREGRGDARFGNSLDESLFRQFHRSPLPGILQQYDRCSMASGVECRMPFMDYRIVEFVFSLDPRAKVGHGFTKRILRDAMRGIVPNETLDNRTKVGFNAPIVDWFRGGLREWMTGIIESKEFRESAYFDGAALQERFREFMSRPDPGWNEAWPFWPAVHLTYWTSNLKHLSAARRPSVAASLTIQ